MIERNRRGLSAEQKAELWKRWKAGQSLNEIGRALGKDHVVVHFVLARHGGIAPPTRRRSRRVLTLAEREDISSPWRPICRFTSAIRRVLGSAARTKTPTGYCGNTCRRTPTCLRFRNQNSTQSLCVLIPDHDKPWDFELRRINSKQVLHRPLETTRLLG